MWAAWWHRATGDQFLCPLGARGHMRQLVQGEDAWQLNCKQSSTTEYTAYLSQEPLEDSALLSLLGATSRVSHHATGQRSQPPLLMARRSPPLQHPSPPRAHGGTRHVIPSFHCCWLRTTVARGLTGSRLDVPASTPRITSDAWLSIPSTPFAMTKLLSYYMPAWQGRPFRYNSIIKSTLRPDAHGLPQHLRQVRGSWASDST